MINIKKVAEMPIASQPLFFNNSLSNSVLRTAGNLVTQLVAHPLLAPRHSDANLLKRMAEPTGLEPATSDVTVRPPGKRKCAKALIFQRINTSSVSTLDHIRLT